MSNPETFTSNRMHTDDLRALLAVQLLAPTRQYLRPDNMNFAGWAGPSEEDIAAAAVRAADSILHCLGRI